MSSVPSLYLVIAFAPLLGAILAGLFGTGFLGNFVSRRGSHLITIALMVVSTVGSFMVLSDVLGGARFDGTLYTYTRAGRRALPALALGSAPAFLAASGSRLLAVGSDGDLKVWDVGARSCVARGSVGPLLQSGSVLSVSLSASGLPLAVLSNMTAAALDPDTYDDGEFYGQLLREFVESAGCGAAARRVPGAKKARKVVDRRASKGRKLRYDVHEKLVAFLAPDDVGEPPLARQLVGRLFGGG